MSKTIYIGIDISKIHFDAATHASIDEKALHKRFENTQKGYRAFLKWIKAQKAESVKTCMEATSCYFEGLATFLYEQNIFVSVHNPYAIKAFAKGKLQRCKSDKADAFIIAEFAAVMDIRAWQPTPEELRELRDLVDRTEVLKATKQAEQNRLERFQFAKGSSIVKKDIKAFISFLEKKIDHLNKEVKDLIKNSKTLAEQSKLLKSIISVGDEVAKQVLSKINIDQFENAKQLAAFIGLSPTTQSSGSSIRRNGTLSKMGSKALRKTLYLPTINAMKNNPIIKAFADRLLLKGKSKMLVIGACMRKMVHIIFGVLKNKTAFDPFFV